MSGTGDDAVSRRGGRFVQDMPSTDRSPVSANEPALSQKPPAKAADRDVIIALLRKRRMA